MYGCVLLISEDANINAESGFDESDAELGNNGICTVLRVALLPAHTSMGPWGPGPLCALKLVSLTLPGAIAVRHRNRTFSTSVGVTKSMTLDPTDSPWMPMATPPLEKLPRSKVFHPPDTK